MKLIFESVNGFKNVHTVLNTEVGEIIDVVFENKRRDPVWSNFGGFIQVRCQNWSGTEVNLEGFKSFQAKLRGARGIVKLGFLISYNGFSSTLPEEGEQLDQVKLANMLHEYFATNELRDLCFELGIAYGDIPGETKMSKVRELVNYSRRHERISELVEICQRLRPKADWRTSFHQGNRLKIDDPYIVHIDRTGLELLIKAGNREQLLRELVRETIDQHS
jgi:hypothetical protein